MQPMAHRHSSKLGLNGYGARPFCFSRIGLGLQRTINDTAVMPTDPFHQLSNYARSAATTPGDHPASQNRPSRSSAIRRSQPTSSLIGRRFLMRRRQWHREGLRTGNVLPPLLAEQQGHRPPRGGFVDEAGLGHAVRLRRVAVIGRSNHPEYFFGSLKKATIQRGATAISAASVRTSSNWLINHLEGNSTKS